MEADGFKRNILNEVSSLRDRVAAAGTYEAELLSNASAVSDQIARTTAVLQQARATIATQRKDLAEVAQLNSSIKSLEDNFAF